MRVAEDTAGRLVLRDRSVALSVICFGVAALVPVMVHAAGQGPANMILPSGAWALFGLVFLHTSTVSFDKTTRVCEIRRFDVIRLKRTRIGFDEIEDVKVEGAPVTNQRWQPTCRLTLVTAGKKYPLTAGYKAGEPQCQAMRETALDTLLGRDPQPMPMPGVDPRARDRA